MEKETCYYITYSCKCRNCGTVLKINQFSVASDPSQPLYFTSTGKYNFAQYEHAAHNCHGNFIGICDVIGYEYDPMGKGS